MLLTHLVLWNGIAVHELPLLVALSDLSVIQEYRDTSVILFLFFFRSNLENCFEFPVYDSGNVVPLFSHQNNRRMKATLMNICISNNCFGESSKFLWWSVSTFLPPSV